MQIQIEVFHIHPHEFEDTLNDQHNLTNDADKGLNNPLSNYDDNKRKPITKYVVEENLSIFTALPPHQKKKHISL